MRSLLAVLLLFASQAQAHGLSTTTAYIELRPNSVLEIRVQFDLIALLNARQHSHTAHATQIYPLPFVASLPDEKFELLYNQVVQLFDTKLAVTNNAHKIQLHTRYPAMEDVQQLLKMHFIEMNVPTRTPSLYTKSDRSHFQQFYFDVKLGSNANIADIGITFPEELGNVYVTYSEPKVEELHAGAIWRAPRE